MKTSWVLTDDERFRRFRKHREKVIKRQFETEDFRGDRTPEQNPEDHLEIQYREADSPAALHIAEPEDEAYEDDYDQDQPIDFSGNSTNAQCKILSIFSPFFTFSRPFTNL